jgi:hypothetical protein
MEYSEYIEIKTKVDDAKQARVRIGVSWLLHMFTVPPVVSIVYSVKTNNWIPTLAATGVALIAAPISLVDFGLTLVVAPPVTSAVLIQTKSQEKRRKLGIFGPEQADKLVYEGLS